MNKTENILDELYKIAYEGLTKSKIEDDNIREKVEAICRCLTNKAPIRFLMSCLLAKIDRPEIDIRKPYTEIKSDDSYSGRTYDESYIQSFIVKYNLPCNPTTAFLTPAFRNIDRVLTTDLALIVKPRRIYTYSLELLDFVFTGKINPRDLLIEIVRFLIIIKTENETRIRQLIKELRHSNDVIPLSSEQIVTLLSQHLASKNASRLPVLIVNAAYIAVAHLGEKPLPLFAHTAADSQTGSIGDVEITLENDDKIVTSYEMKNKRVIKNDIDHALSKIKSLDYLVDNYIFITTDIIDEDVKDYAYHLYDEIGVEIAILDCIGFIRHYLHFFHRFRSQFLDAYQSLVLSQPDSAVSQPLKEAFLALRRAAESDKQ